MLASSAKKLPPPMRSSVRAALVYRRKTAYAAGYVPVPLGPEDYIELLPATWRVINSYGVKIGLRTYDSGELNPYRRQHSGIEARNGRWEVARCGLIVSGDAATGKTAGIKQLGRLHELRVRARLPTGRVHIPPTSSTALVFQVCASPVLQLSKTSRRACRPWRGSPAAGLRRRWWVPSSPPRRPPARAVPGRP